MFSRAEAQPHIPIMGRQAMAITPIVAGTDGCEPSLRALDWAWFARARRRRPITEPGMAAVPGLAGAFINATIIRDSAP
jgi:hypothetical protein